MSRDLSSSLRGFSLLELVGVMAVIAILSAVLAPNLVGVINDAYATAETENLISLADQLERSVLNTSVIPGNGSASWGAAIAAQSDLPLQDVLQNRRGFTRTVYFDPGFLNGTGGFNGYTQTTGLSAPPASPRFMIISDLSGNLGTQANNVSRFDAIWNRDPAATIVESDTVKIERRHIGDLFHRALIINEYSYQTGVSLNGGAQLAIPAAQAGADGLLSMYLIEGTEIALFDGPYPTGGLLTARLVDDYVTQRIEDPSAGSGSGGNAGAAP
ncbi:MAG: prepilin-type N-terminal cleavage/methylation domain-containing protein [Pseudomonadota bacterium]